MFSIAPRAFPVNAALQPPLDGRVGRRADKSSPRRLSCFSMESRAMSDKLLINLFGLTISADGIYAIVAAVIIIVLVVARPR